MWYFKYNQSEDVVYFKYDIGISIQNLNIKKNERIIINKTDFLFMILNSWAWASFLEYKQKNTISLFRQKKILNQSRRAQTVLIFILTNIILAKVTMLFSYTFMAKPLNRF